MGKTDFVIIKDHGIVVPKEISKETKAALNILIREIQDIMGDPATDDIKLWKIKKLLDTWISANKLNPKQVVAMSIEEFRKWFNIIEQEEKQTKK